jgi:hypothetical protein
VAAGRPAEYELQNRQVPVSMETPVSGIRLLLHAGGTHMTRVLPGSQARARSVLVNTLCLSESYDTGQSRWYVPASEDRLAASLLCRSAHRGRE